MPHPIRRALLSVSDKTGLIEFAQGLQTLGVELISTGGTRKTLAGAGLPVKDISDVTGFPEILDGRVKTLHPRVHAGILAIRNNREHRDVLTAQGIETIDLVVVNLYPFEETVARQGSSHEEIVENIDIGGPSMIRAAAKNYHDAAIVVDPGQYDAVLTELRDGGGILSSATHERLAAAAFERTAAYDQAIAAYFARRNQQGPFPKTLMLRFDRKQLLRYGENPHQPAAFYIEPGIARPTVATAEILHGKELSYNNLLDLDSALSLVREFAAPAAVVLKHNNPCGAATATSLDKAFEAAYEGDPLSAFGGILGFNRSVDAATATQVTEPNRFIECIIAPGFSDEAFQILTTRRKWGSNLRLLRVGDFGPAEQTLDYRRVDGGLLVQSRDAGGDDFAQSKVVTKRAPTPEERVDLDFAWRVCKHVKSNAIVLASNSQVVGVGAGQMSRVDSVQISIRKAGSRTRASVMASDAFFPFPDSVELASAAGVSAIVQPGGSVKDADSIAACDRAGLAMIFTGVRHFRH
jgi:phosphoribosylaminoimidazolecarboxamide formyltransferase/IMP cyclohydrolase